MSIICAWCETVIQRVAAAAPALPGQTANASTSHGICRACMERQLQR